MIFLKMDWLSGFGRAFGPGTVLAHPVKNERKRVEAEERWAVRIALGGLALGFIGGVFNAAIGLGIALFGFMLGITLRIDAACGRHAMNQREMLEVQRELVDEIRSLVAGRKSVKATTDRPV